MDFLKELNFPTEVIKKIKAYNDKSLIFNFICSKKNVIKNIDYLRNIGVEVIELLLIYRLELFLIDNSMLIKSFENFEIATLVKLINEDINAVNLL